MRSHSYLNSAVKIIGDYKGEEPLSAALKKYFSANKKFGSRDRKHVAHLCYCFFRLGKAITEARAEERILIGLFLCSTQSNEMLQEIKPEWNSRVEATIPQKLLMIPVPLLIKDVFPWNEQVSNGLDHEKFCESFFIQPNLYLRIRPGREQSVKDKLLRSGTSFTEIEVGCLSLSNATKIEEIIDLDKEAVVQDLSSQQVVRFLELPVASRLPIAAWDCCAGSGGKSLLLHDRFPTLDLTVSDIRESIIVNLKKRFAKAGIKKYHWFVADLANLNSQFTPDSYRDDNSPFDLVICDAPCTGSGTWSRTPEQLYFFDKKKIDQYALLQRKIVTNVIPQLKPGGLFVYVTCSVFKKENEDIVDYVEQQSPLRMIEMKFLKGYENRADSMFVSILRKTL